MIVQLMSRLTLSSIMKRTMTLKLIQLPENTGSPSEPRNIGMRGTRKYITLLDADDWLDKEGFPQVIEKVNADDADLGYGQSYKHKSKREASC